MISLQPQQVFPIVRQLDNPADVTGYFIQAVVRNARTGAILTTVNLTDKGNGRFTTNYSVPADTSGLGFYIDITTLVFTDSGYTTPSTTYGSVSETYQVYDSVASRQGGGATIVFDYGEIDKRMAKHIESIEKPVPVTFDALMPHFERIHSKIEDIKMPETDLAPHTEEIKGEIGKLFDGMKTLAKMIDEKPHLTPEKETQITSLLESIKSIVEDETHFDPMKASVQEMRTLKGQFEDLFKQKMPDIHSALDYVSKMVKEMSAHIVSGHILSTHSSRMSRSEPKEAEQFVK